MLSERKRSQHGLCIFWMFHHASRSSSTLLVRGQRRWMMVVYKYPEWTCCGVQRLSAWSQREMKPTELLIWTNCWRISPVTSLFLCHVCFHWPCWSVFWLVWFLNPLWSHSSTYMCSWLLCEQSTFAQGSTWTLADRADVDIYVTRTKADLEAMN